MQLHVVTHKPGWVSYDVLILDRVLGSWINEFAIHWCLQSQTEPESWDGRMPSETEDELCLVEDVWKGYMLLNVTHTAAPRSYFFFELEVTFDPRDITAIFGVHHQKIVSVRFVSPPLALYSHGSGHVRIYGELPFPLGATGGVRQVSHFAIVVQHFHWWGKYSRSSRMCIELASDKNQLTWITRKIFCACSSMRIMLSLRLKGSQEL